MRKTLAVTIVAGTVLGGLTLPAWAAAPNAPTDLQVGWLGPTDDRVKITWADGGEANTLRVEYQDGTRPALIPVKAEVQNEFVKFGETLVRENQIARISIVSVGADGAESAPTVSPWFDSTGPSQAEFTTATRLADGSVKADWSLIPPPADTTPDDPLDRPSSHERVLVYVREDVTTSTPAIVLPAGSTSTTVAPQPRPYFGELMTSNEWGISRKRTGPTAYVLNKVTTSLKLPTGAVFSNAVAFNALAGVGKCPHPNLSCSVSNPIIANPGIRPELQTRRDSTQAWKTIGRYSNQNLEFTGTFCAEGGGEYRLYIPAWSYRTDPTLTIAPAASTSPRRIAVQAKFVTAGFNTSTAAVSQPVKATVSIQPATTAKADLQWYDGTRWRHSSYISLVNGKGTTTFKAAGRGTTHSWRVVTPALTYNGLPIASTPSNTFKLTVR